MFDIGFLELLMIMIIALIVIGPERMPEVARKLGSFMGKTRRFIESVKQENHVQETINDFKDSVNLEAEKEKITNLHSELEESLKVGTEKSQLDDFDLDEFQRPFGGNSASGSQFNRAPSQPELPGATDETSAPAPAQETAQTKPAANTQQASKEASAPAQESTASTSDTTSTASQDKPASTAADSSKS